MKRVDAQQEFEIQKFLEADRLMDQEDLRSRLTDSPQKSLEDFEVRKIVDDLILSIVELSESSIPTFLVSMSVAADLTASFSYRGLPLSGIQFCNVHSGGKLESLDQVDSVLMAMKNWSRTGGRGVGWLEMAKKCLDRFVEEEEGETGGPDKSLKKFFSQINRGGLYRPTVSAFGIGLKCWSVFDCIQCTPSLSSRFLRSGAHEKNFCQTVLALLQKTWISRTFPSIDYLAQMGTNSPSTWLFGFSIVS